MSILRIQHIGVVVRDLKDACDRFQRTFGLTAQDFRDDQGQGRLVQKQIVQYDARILLGNECWLHLVQNWNPESRVNHFLNTTGEGLEHIALETNSIEKDVAHLRSIGVPIFEDTIFDAQDGYEAFILPDQLPGLTIELIQSHDRSWVYPEAALGQPISSCMHLLQLQHLGLVVADLKSTSERFEKLFGLKAIDFRDDQGQGTLVQKRTVQYDARILFPNHCWLHLVQNWNPESRVNRFLSTRGEGLDHIALQSSNVHEDVAYLLDQQIPIFDDEIKDAQDGYEAFVYPDQLPGMTVELIQPHAHSWNFTEKP